MNEQYTNATDCGQGCAGEIKSIRAIDSTQNYSYNLIANQPKRATDYNSTNNEEIRERLRNISPSESSL